MSNIYDIFNERKSSVSMISEGFDYDSFDMDSVEHFDSIEEGIEVLENLQKEMQDANIRLCAESLVSDLLLEENMYEDFDEEQITEMIEESLKEKASNVGKKIQELWGRVRAWFAGLFNSITNHFKNGEALLKKYPDLKNRLQNDSSKVKAYKMVGAAVAIKQCSTLSDKLSFYDVYETKDFKSSVFGKLGVQDKKELKTTVMNFFVMGKLEKEEIVIRSLNPAIVINYAVSKKDIIDGLKNQQRNLDNDFKDALTAAKRNKSDAEDRETKKYVNEVMSVLNFIFNVKSDIIKVETAMVKKLSSMCLSICRHACGGASSSAKSEEPKPEPENKGEYIPTKQDKAAGYVARNKAAAKKAKTESFDYLMSSLNEDVEFEDEDDFDFDA